MLGLIHPSTVVDLGGETTHYPVYEASLECSTVHGKFVEFEQKLPQLHRLGVKVIWLMPIFPRGGNPPGKPVSDSAYCVRDYTAVDRRYGTLDELRSLVKTSHGLGMKVVLDIVPNHTSWGHPWITEHPDFYKKNPIGEIVPPDPWPDVAKLNYRNHRLWEAMAKAHEFWVYDVGVDGFREDVAGDVPTEFWQWLRPRLERNRRVYLLAEADKPELHQVFDATYDWTIQVYFYMIARGEWDARTIDKCLAEETKRYPKGAVRLRHLTNHDMQDMRYAWANRDYIDPSKYRFLESTTLAEKYGKGVRAFMLLCATLPNSQPMIWNGQEDGILDRTPAPITRTNADEYDFYAKLLNAVDDREELRVGSFRRLHTDSDDAIYAYERVKGKKRSIVVVNLSNREVTVDLPSIAKLTNVFDGTSASRTATLQPWGYRLYASPNH